MNLELKVRSFARRHLPAGFRQPLGRFSGVVQARLLYPLMGFFFDLGGGRYRADGCTFIIPKNITSLEFRASFLMDSYEEDERKLVQDYILPDDCVLELGACLGIIACITNRRLRNPARHVVVEANPYCLPAIHRNRSLNQASFLVEHCAVCEVPEVTFSIHPTHITGSAIDGRSGTKVRLPGRSLTELTARYGPFTVLIMDVEGSELQLLEASVKTLEQFRLVIIELHESVIGAAGLKRCREILTDSGFALATQSFITEAWVRR